MDHPKKEMIATAPLSEEQLEAVFLDIEKGSDRLFSQLAPAQRDWFIRLFENLSEGDEAMLEALYAQDYDHIPVPPDVFFSEPDYMGHMGKNLYKAWWPHVLEICDPQRSVSEVIFTGAIGFGKCQRASSLVNTDDGFLTIEEIVSEKYKGRVQHEEGHGRVKARFAEGRIPTVLVKTKLGHEVEGSPHHRYRVLRGLKRTWVRSDALRPGDILLGEPAAEFPIVDYPCEAEAELCGWYIAEGTPVSYGANLSLHPSEIMYVHDLATRAMETLLIDGVGLLKNGISLKGGHSVASLIREKWGSALSGAKEVPRYIRQGTKRTICAFLRGLFSGDGDVSPVPELVTTSPHLAEQVGVLLSALGIYNAVRSKRAKLNGKDYGVAYRVVILGAPSKRAFREHIGFVQPEKQKRLEVQCKSSRNDDHFVSFRLSKADARALSAMQPTERGGRYKRSRYGDKKKSPKGLLKRVVAGQGVTHTLLQKVLDADGVLPPDLEAIACGELMFDVVKSTTPSTAVCYDLSVAGNPTYISNGFISHNSFVANAFLIPYKIYWLSCLKNPARYFGLADDTKIVIGIYAITKDHAEEIGFYDLRDQAIDNSPYFRYAFPRVPNDGNSLVFDKGIRVLVGSKELHAIGHNLFAISMDELNFYEQGKGTKKKAHDLVAAVSRRTESRFRTESGIVAGFVVLISSKRTETDYLEARLRKIKKLPGVYVVDAAFWDFDEKTHYSGKRFRVQLGDEFRDAKILDEVQFDDDGIEVTDIKEVEREDDTAEVIPVPVEHYKAFVEDLNGSIRDIAGRSTRGFTPFFGNKQVVTDMADASLPLAFDAESLPIYLADKRQIVEAFNVNRLCQVDMNRWRPSRHRAAPRYLHIDLAKNKDAAGVSMIHPSSHFITKEEDEEGRPREEDGVPIITVVKEIEVDFAVAITAGPRGEEIDFQKIRNFIFFLRSIGFWIRRVTYDSWESVDSIQQLRGAKFDADVQSVDRTAIPYKTLRRAMAERRVKAPPHELLRTELIGLEHDVEADKVDHREGESKDVADALCGAVYGCLTDKIKPGDVPPEHRGGGGSTRTSKYDKYLDQLKGVAK